MFYDCYSLSNANYQILGLKVRDQYDILQRRSYEKLGGML
jgi:hypothetical protein